MPSDFYVYQLRLQGEAMPFYIGKGRGKRYLQHTWPSSLKIRSRRTGIIQGALRRGVEILPEIISKNLSEESAFTLERGLIAKHGRLDQGTGCLSNHTDGGDGASGRIYKMSQAQKDHLSKLKTGVRLSPEHRIAILSRPRQTRSLEHRRHLSSSKRGQQNPAAKLTEEKVLGIYRLLRAGVSRSEIAAGAGVRVGQIDRIRQGKKWAHLHHHFLAVG